MNELQLLTMDDVQFPIPARKLHEALEIETPYHKWFPRMCEYGFVEDVDFNTDKNVRVQNEGGREVKREVIDHHTTISMAKEICMLQRTEKGKQLRLYLIDIEKQWNEPELVMARALQMAAVKIEKLSLQVDKLYAENTELLPKAQFYDTVADCDTAITFSAAAKVLNFKGIGRNKLFELLRKKGLLRPNNEPYQQYVDCGYFKVVEKTYEKDGEPEVRLQTLIYQKGLDYIRKQLEQDGISKRRASEKTQRVAATGLKLVTA